MNATLPQRQRQREQGAAEAGAGLRLPLARAAMPSLSILFFTRALTLGGAELSIVRLARTLGAKGHRVSIAVQSGGGELASLVPPGVRVVDLAVTSTLASVLPLLRLMRELRPDVAISGLVHCNLLLIAAVKLGRLPVRTVVTEHAPPYALIAAYPSWRYRILPRLMRWLYPRADAVVAVSGGVRDELDSILGGSRRAQVVPNPVVDDDLGAQAEAPLPAVPAGLFEAPLILGVGRLSREKRFDRLIHAVAEIRRRRDCRLAILGEGPERASLTDLAQQWGLGGSIWLPGYVANPYPIMRRAAVLVVTSDFEGFGNVLVEAMACGTPVVSTNCPHGPQEILENGRLGRLVPLGDEVALVQAIERTMDEPRQPEQLRARARDYSVGRSAALYEALCVQICEARKTVRISETFWPRKG